MRALRLRACLIGLLAGLPAAAGAQAFSIRSEVDQTRIGVQDRLQLTITLSGSVMPDEVPFPMLANLRVAGGPFESQSMSVTLGPQGPVQQVARSYIYVLQPLAVGAAEVGEIRVKVGATSHVAPPIPVDVVAGSVRPKATEPPPDSFGDDPFESMFRRRRGRPQEPKVFIDATLDRERVYVGEPVLLTYFIYTQTSLTDQRFGDPPKYPGFWSEKLPPPSYVPGGEPVTVQGETFRRFPVEQKLLFPTRHGKLTIPAASVKLGVQTGGGFFDFPQNVVLERATRALTLTADPIPEQPGFSGAVGRFTAQASVDKPSVALGEAVTLRFEVQGSGNLKWIDRGPEVKVAGAKVYAPQVKSDLKAAPSGISGSKTWEFVIVPETSGALEIPALAFAYFDVDKKQVVRRETAAIPFRVQGGGGASAAPARGGSGHTRASGPAALRSDLDLPLRTQPVLSGGRLAGLLAAVLVVHGALWASPWLLQRRGHTGGRPGRGRDLRRAVADLERAGRDGMSKEASVALIEKTLHDVFGPLEDSSSAPEGERERAAREVLQEVYFIRYAPQLGDYSDQIRNVARRAADVVRKWA